MKIYSVLIGANHLLFESEIGSDFWITLGDGEGWGRLSMLRPLQEQAPGRSLFRLVEILPADAEAPVAVVNTECMFQLTKQLRGLLDRKLNLPTERSMIE